MIIDRNQNDADPQHWFIDQAKLNHANYILFSKLQVLLKLVKFTYFTNYIEEFLVFSSHLGNLQVNREMDRFHDLLNAAGRPVIHKSEKEINTSEPEFLNF